jgi:Domain of unknown function (DUF4232)
VRRLAVMVGVLALAVPALTASGVAATERGLATCTGSHLSGRLAGSSGAAGTISFSVRLRNISNRRCTMTGYPRLRILDGASRLPTRVTRGGGVTALQRPVRTVRLAPGGVATVMLAYEDVPVGNETTCPTGDALLLRPPGSASAVRVAVETTACGRGHLWTSPILAGRVPLQ